MGASEGQPMGGLRVQISKGSGRQPWRLSIVAANGEILAHSEGYSTRWSVRRAARRWRLPVVDLTA